MSEICLYESKLYQACQVLEALLLNLLKFSFKLNVNSNKDDEEKNSISK